MLRLGLLLLPLLLLVVTSAISTAITTTSSDNDTPLFTGASIRSVSVSSDASVASSSTNTHGSSISDATLHQIHTRALRDEQPDAMYVLAMLQFYGQRVARDVTGAVRLLTRLAQHHAHGDAQFTLGVLLTSSDATDGVQRDDRRGAAWLAMSVARGHADAPWVLATLVNAGRGVARDPHRALALLRQTTARRDAHPRALFHLGTMYEYGHGGVARDATKAAQLYQQASDRHVTDATYYLALLYAAGRGVPKHSVLARQLLTRAADAGHAAALLRLGEMHADGDGVGTIDYAAALSFLQRAHAAAATDSHVQTLVQRRVHELQLVLTKAETHVRALEQSLGMAPLRVQVATIDRSGR